MRTRFSAGGTPFLLFLDGDGKEVDWISGYAAPAARFHDKVKKVLAGEGTYRALSDRLAAAPNDVALMAEIAGKLQTRSDKERTAAMLRRILDAGPAAVETMTTVEAAGAQERLDVSCAEFAEFGLAQLQGYEDPRHFRAFLDAHPAGALAKQASQRLAIIYMMGGSADEAGAFYEDLAEKFPDDPVMMMYRLNWLQRQPERLDEAIALARRLATLRNSPNDLYTLASLYGRKKDLDMAEAVFGPDAIEAQISSFAYLLNSYAMFWIGQNRHADSALAMLEKGLALDPDNPYAFRTAAQVMAKANRPEEVDGIYGPAYAERNREDAQALVLYAEFWAGQGRNEASAVAAAEAALALKPDDANVLQSVARAFVAWKRPDRALAVYGPGVLAKIGENALALNSYAWFWAGQKQNLESAREAALKSIALDDRDYTRDTLAAVYLHLGRLDEALAEITRAISMSTTPSRYRAMEKTIKDAIEKKKLGK